MRRSNENKANGMIPVHDGGGGWWKTWRGSIRQAAGVASKWQKAGELEPKNSLSLLKVYATKVKSVNFVSFQGGKRRKQVRSKTE